ncbi:hypothetical protein L227DRAFT_311506 [Lentinus tigrinus ALCF2SS1-6]|uniref:Uncharacterized protein n=1 Tax=Lentinus tigrinus ALCF2SS1-6 TaxID=1328759 RepID=A0A5C2RVX5_9APHY|nr:hypothetical protein L227DRAFT_311506 [Lentinus tigrinus ALCF2SS1-6]
MTALKEETGGGMTSDERPETKVLVERNHICTDRIACATQDRRVQQACAIRNQGPKPSSCLPKKPGPSCRDVRAEHLPTRDRQIHKHSLKFVTFGRTYAENIHRKHTTGHAGCRIPHSSFEGRRPSSPGAPRSEAHSL